MVTSLPYRMVVREGLESSPFHHEKCIRSHLSGSMVRPMLSRVLTAASRVHFSRWVDVERSVEEAWNSKSST